MTFTKEFGEILTYHSIGIYSDFWSLWYVLNKLKSEFCEAMSESVLTYLCEYMKPQAFISEIVGPIVVRMSEQPRDTQHHARIWKGLLYTWHCMASAMM